MNSHVTCTRARDRKKMAAFLHDLIFGVGGTGTSEPSPRWYPFSAAVEGKVYLYGGRTGDFLKETTTLKTTVHTFDGYLEQWEKIGTWGYSPPGLYRGACASTGHHLYVYGGFDGNQDTGSLHRLDTWTLMWTQLHQSANADPMHKRNCGMVSHGKELILFGGFGLQSNHTQPGAEYDGGYTNELHSFKLKESKGMYNEGAWGRG